MMLKFLFWLFFFLIVYAYAGYTLLLMILAGFNRLLARPHLPGVPYEPCVTLFIPAYNEEDCVDDKIANTKELNYPPEKLQVIWITDGSTDRTLELLNGKPGIRVFHERDRRGKIHAMNRGIRLVDTPIVIFTDANTMLNREAIREMVRYFADEKTGCVAGEKRISAASLEKAVSAGEGLYWKYESLIKILESETGSAVGAVGELFAFRRELYEEVNEDTLLDDFTISLIIARKGYNIKYAPDAWGSEKASVSIAEEMKRKIRIATGGMQALFRMKDLLNPFRYGLLSVKYISHKVLRWTVVPVAFPMVLVLNAAILFTPGHSVLYPVLFILQCVYYMLVFAGALLHNVKPGLKAIFAPYYLLIMNYAVVAGVIRYFTGKYSVNWQKVKRG